MGTSVISELRPVRSGNCVYVTPHSAISDPSRVPARTIFFYNIIIGGMDRVGIKKIWPRSRVNLSIGVSEDANVADTQTNNNNNVTYSKSTTAGGAVLRKSD